MRTLSVRLVSEGWWLLLALTACDLVRPEDNERPQVAIQEAALLDSVLLVTELQLLDDGGLTALDVTLAPDFDTLRFAFGPTLPLDTAYRRPLAGRLLSLSDSLSFAGRRVPGRYRAIYRAIDADDLGSVPDTLTFTLPNAAFPRLEIATFDDTSDTTAGVRRGDTLVVATSLVGNGALAVAYYRLAPQRDLNQTLAEQTFALAGPDADTTVRFSLAETVVGLDSALVFEARVTNAAGAGRTLRRYFTTVRE